MKKYFNAKILAANLVHVQELDNMIVKLIRTRYNDLNEYKQKILTQSNLPSYVENLIYESGDFLSNPRNQNILIGLINDFSFQKKLRDLSNLNLNSYAKLATSTPALTSSLLNTFLVNQNTSGFLNNNNNNINNQSGLGNTSMNQSMSMNVRNASFKQHDFNNNSMSNKNNTSNYMRRLEKVRINKDLDHNDFDLSAVESGYDIEFENQQQMRAIQNLQQKMQYQQQPAAPMMYIDEQDEEIMQLNSKYSPLLMLNVNTNGGRASSTDLYSPTNKTANMSAIKSPVMLSAKSSNQRVNFQFSPRLNDERPSSSISNQTVSSGASGSAAHPPQKFFNQNGYLNSNGGSDDYHSAQLLSPGSMYSANSGARNMIDINTPKTPSSMYQHKSQFGGQSESMWGNGTMSIAPNAKQPALTPPPSACSTQNKPNMFANKINSNNNNPNSNDSSSANDSSATTHVIINPLLLNNANQTHTGIISEFESKFNQSEQQINFSKFFLLKYFKLFNI